jgi:hypothetical protein
MNSEDENNISGSISDDDLNGNPSSNESICMRSTQLINHSNGREEINQTNEISQQPPSDDEDVIFIEEIDNTETSDTSFLKSFWNLEQNFR